MKSSKLGIIVVVVIIAVIVSAKVIFTKDNSKVVNQQKSNVETKDNVEVEDKKEVVNKKNKDGVELIRKQYDVFFSKKDKKYVSKPVEVKKDNTKNIMFISIENEEKIKKLIDIKVYQNDKVIYKGNYKENFKVPYKINGQNTTFKLELKYKKDIKDDKDEEYANVVWYVNKTP